MTLPPATLSMSPMEVLLQANAFNPGSRTGCEPTVITIVTGAPVQPFLTGVTIYVAVPSRPVVFVKVSVMLADEGSALAVPPVNNGLTGLSTGAPHVKVTLSAGFVKLLRRI